jgi:hypothetical protein
MDPDRPCLTGTAVLAHPGTKRVLTAVRITRNVPVNQSPLSLMAIALLLAMCLPLSTQANGETGSVEHIVVVWLKTPGDRAAQDKVIAASQVLKSIPGVTSLKAGTMIPSERPTVDSSFDIALSVTFTDAKAMQHYLTHPNHIQLVEETLKPLVDKIRVYDYRY